MSISPGSRDVVLAAYVFVHLAMERVFDAKRIYAAAGGCTSLTSKHLLKFLAFFLKAEHGMLQTCSGTRTLPGQSTSCPPLPRSCTFRSSTLFRAVYTNKLRLIWNLLLKDKINTEHILHAHYRAITDINWHTTECDTVVSTGIDSWIWAWDLRDPRKPVFGTNAFEYLCVLADDPQACLRLNVSR